jgi:hypothetical protein
VDEFLADTSWDKTWGRMLNLVSATLNENINKNDRKVREITTIQKVAYV